MKFKYYILLIAASFMLCGCASASPLDWVLPTRKPSLATTEYLGHLYRTNYVNGVYHSLTDTKIEKAMVGIRKMELQGLHYAAKGETELLDAMYSKVSDGAWAGLLGALSLTGLGAGVLIPRPGEKARIKEAGMTPPDDFIKMQKG